jgi:purine catabolism regulator
MGSCSFACEDRGNMHIMLSVTQALPGDADGLRAMYQALVEQIPAVLYINAPDDEATTLFVSPQTEDILQLPAEAWFTGEWIRHVHPDDVGRLNQNYEAALRSAAVDVDEYRFIRPDGTVIWIHDRVTIIRDDDGAPKLVQGLMFDITDQRQAQTILEQQAQQAAKIDAIARRFNELVLAGTSLREVVETVADIVNNPVVLEDPAHQVIEFAERKFTSTTLLQNWERHARAPHPLEEGAVRVRDADTELACSWIAIRIREEEWGRLHVLALESNIDELDRLALDRASAAIGLSLLADRRTSRLADEARSNLVADLRQGRWQSGSDIAARMHSLGATVPESRVMALMIEARNLSGTLDQEAPLRQRALEHLLTGARRALLRADVVGLCAVLDDCCIAIVGLDSETDARRVTELIATDITDAAKSFLPELSIVVGASRVTTAEGLRQALSEAAEAATYGVRVARRAGVQRADDLGLRLLLGRLGERPDLSHFVEDELGPLLKFDDRRVVDLLETLRVYLDSGCHKVRTALALHIDRRTLYYRLRQIESVLHCSLDDAEQRLRLNVALHGLDVLRDRAPRFD